MSLFSSKTKELFLGPLGKNNPITIQILGICSALAVTAKLEPAVVMGFSVIVVVALMNWIIALLRKTIPGRIRMIVQLVIAAALVTVISEILKAFAYDVSVQLSIYIGLIVTNCILMGRLEAFAMSNKPMDSLIDGISNGIGYAWVLIVVGFFRELLGMGTLLGYQIIPQSFYLDNGGFYANNSLMILPPMALILVAIIIWVQRAGNKKLQEK
jgi:Na+-transporting NADH:ubiquinone oxidoreductase subunit D